MAIRKSAPPTMQVKGIAFVIMATVFWSSSGIFISFIMKESGLSAVGLAFWRDLSTFVVLLVGVGVTNPRRLRVDKSDLPWLAAMGTISIGIFHILWNNAVIMIGASLATVIQCNAPIFVTIMAYFIFQETITTRKLIAIALAVAGTVLVSGLNGGGWEIVPIGSLIALGSAVMYGTFSLFGKKLSGDYSSWTILLYVFGFGTLALFLFQLGRPEPWPSSAAIIPWFTGLVLISTVAGFASYTAGLQKLPASIASITAMTEILFASILAYIFLGERLDVWQIVGAILIISGVALVSLDKRAGKIKE